jgi:hypothetical protein
MKPKKIGCECVTWIIMVQDRIQWQALVNMVIHPLLKKVLLHKGSKSVILKTNT